MKRFEYKSLNIHVDTGFMNKIKNFEEIDNHLNSLGYEGWELVNFVVGVYPSSYDSVFVILKRERLV